MEPSIYICALWTVFEQNFNKLLRKIQLRNCATWVHSNHRGIVWKCKLIICVLLDQCTSGIKGLIESRNLKSQCVFDTRTLYTHKVVETYHECDMILWCFAHTPSYQSEWRKLIVRSIGEKWSILMCVCACVFGLVVPTVFMAFLLEKRNRAFCTVVTATATTTTVAHESFHYIFKAILKE